MKGRCLCHSGWKGAECDVPTNQCIDVACSNHGTCIMGTCICNPGYKGENCEEGKTCGQAARHLAVRQRPAGRATRASREQREPPERPCDPHPQARMPSATVTNLKREDRRIRVLLSEGKRRVCIEHLLYASLCAKSLGSFSFKPQQGRVIICIL